LLRLPVCPTVPGDDADKASYCRPYAPLGRAPRLCPAWPHRALPIPRRAGSRPICARCEWSAVATSASGYLPLSLWHRLGLDSLLAEPLPCGHASVGWAHTAALDDLLGMDTVSVNDDRLYCGPDRFGEHKDARCAHLMARYPVVFGRDIA